MNSPTTTQPAVRASGRPFDSVMIALSAALLVIFGIVIGRFMITSQAVDVVGHFETELSTLRAEVADLNRQLLATESQLVAVEKSAEGYRQLASQQQLRADRLEARQQLIEQTIARVADERQTCLSEVQEYVALNQPIPATDVLRFAEEMFDTHAETLRRLSGQSESVAQTMPSLPTLHVSNTQLQTQSPQSELEPTLAEPTLAAKYANEYPALPALTETTTSKPQPAKSGVYFARPAPKRASRGYTFFAPKRSKPLATFAEPTGIIFHSTADADDTIRR